jgi:hypothetical protein
MYDLPYIKYEYNKIMTQRLNTDKYVKIHNPKVINLIYQGKRLIKKL